MSVDMLLVLLALLLLSVRWGLGGIFRNHATGSMLWGVVDSCKARECSGFAFVDPDNRSTSESRNRSQGSHDCLHTWYTGPVVSKGLEGHV